jgi:hypothetical protein
MDTPLLACSRGAQTVGEVAMQSHVVLPRSSRGNRSVSSATGKYQCGDQPSLDAGPQSACLRAYPHRQAESVNGGCLRHGLCLPCFFCESCLSMRQKHNNTLQRNKLQLFFFGGGGGRQTRWNVRQFRCSFWAWQGAAQKTMGRRLGRQASPRWSAGRFNLQNAPVASRSARLYRQTGR